MKLWHNKLQDPGARCPQQRWSAQQISCTHACSLCEESLWQLILVSVRRMALSWRQRSETRRRRQQCPGHRCLRPTSSARCGTLSGAARRAAPRWWLRRARTAGASQRGTRGWCAAGRPGACLALPDQACHSVHHTDVEVGAASLLVCCSFGKATFLAA